MTPQNQTTGMTKLKIYWDKFVTAAAMSSCAQGIICGEKPDSFMRLKSEMAELDKKLDDLKQKPTLKP